VEPKHETLKLSKVTDPNHYQRAFFYCIAALLIIFAAFGSGYLLWKNNNPTTITNSNNISQTKNKPLKMYGHMLVYPQSEKVINYAGGVRSYTQNDLWLINSDGSRKRLTTTQDISSDNIMWSPNNTYVLAELSSVNGDYLLINIRSGVSKKISLTSYGDVEWLSEDTVIYSTNTPGYDIYSYYVTTDKKNIFLSPYKNQSPFEAAFVFALSLDKKWLHYYLSPGGGPTSIDQKHYAYNIENKKTVTLSKVPERWYKDSLIYSTGDYELTLENPDKTFKKILQLKPDSTTLGGRAAVNFVTKNDKLIYTIVAPNSKYKLNPSNNHTEDEYDHTQYEYDLLTDKIRMLGFNPKLHDISPSGEEYNIEDYCTNCPFIFWSN
jgi:hypothetical protein